MTEQTTARMHVIRLELARSKEHPQGSAGEGYEFHAPLDETLHIDAESWKKERARCFVHKIEGGRTVERGLLVHKPGGAGGATWSFDYDYQDEGDEEAGYRFGAHAFTVGEYVSVRDEDGEMHTYRVAGVRPE
ncbi:MAG: hypothetical protein AB7F96_04865 [Beijerinckiaceae bacterium]